jgi:predicted Rdx family selenoprotein
MNLVETFSHGIQTKTFDYEGTGTIYYHVLVEGRLVWRREARSGTHQRQRLALSTAQRQEALHLVHMAERDTDECYTDQLHA